MSRCALRNFLSQMIDLRLHGPLENSMDNLSGWYWNRVIFACGRKSLDYRLKDADEVDLHKRVKDDIDRSTANVIDKCMVSQHGKFTEPNTEHSFH